MPKNRLGPKMNTVRQKVTSECNKLRHEHTIRTSEKDQTRTYLSHARLHLCPSRKKNNLKKIENIRELQSWRTSCPWQQDHGIHVLRSTG